MALKFRFVVVFENGIAHMLINVVWVSVFSDFSIVNQFLEVLFRFAAGSPIFQYDFPALWDAPAAIVGWLSSVMGKLVDRIR